MRKLVPLLMNWLLCPLFSAAFHASLFANALCTPVFDLPTPATIVRLGTHALPKAIMARTFPLIGTFYYPRCVKPMEKRTREGAASLPQVLSKSLFLVLYSSRTTAVLLVQLVWVYIFSRKSFSLMLPEKQNFGSMIILLNGNLL